MYLLISNITFAISIFLLTVIVGFIPLKIAKHNTSLFGLCDAFASGIFLSTALLHLLPDAVHDFGAIYTTHYPIAYLVCIVTYVTLLIMERGALIYNNINPTNNKIIMPTFLVALFVIHSLVEGAAIGANTSFLEAVAIFFAVFAHKGSESFALTVNLHHFGISTKNIRQTIAIYSLMTPIGIFIASSLVYTSSTSSGGMLSGIFNAVTAGTFLYLGTEHLVEGKKSFGKISEVLALLLGVAVMGSVALLV